MAGFSASALSYAAAAAPARGLAWPALIPGSIAFAVIFLIAYRYSLWRRPMTICRRCGGKGHTGGMVFFWARAWCTKCGATGLVPRLGTRVLYALEALRAMMRRPPAPEPDDQEPQWPDGTGQPWPPDR